MKELHYAWGKSLDPQGKVWKNERDLTDFPRLDEMKDMTGQKMKGDLWKIENVSGWLDENHTLAGWSPNPGSVTRSWIKDQI